MTLRLGISSGAFYPATLTEDAPALAASWGISDLELMLQTHGEYDPAFIAAVERNVRAAGSRIHALHTNLFHPVSSPYPRRIEEGRALFLKAVDAAHHLDADAIVWHGATRDEMADPATWDRFLALTSAFARACAEAGVALAIENVSWCVLATVRDVTAFAARIPELAPPGSLGFAFDPFQAAEANANHFMMLSAMRGHIVDVHLSDFRAGARHLRPGQGDLPWSALLRAIANNGYAGPMAIEAPLASREDLEAAREFLEPLLQSIAQTGEADDHELPTGIQEGIRLFNEGSYYEAHEVIEHEWHAEPRPIRRLYQGILQIGVGFHHARNGNHRGAVLLITDGIEKTSAFLPARLGLDLARLVHESQIVLDAIIAAGPENLASINLANLPTIHAILDNGVKMYSP
jgi:sugar phosphate isomerase/epimerase